jgi:hypothetical protein
MKVVTLYTVVTQEVDLGDGYTLSHSPGDEPRCAIGNGMVLVGIPQMPPRSVQRCEALADGGEAYLALDPPLRELLEAPLRAELARRLDEYRAAAEREIQRHCGGPWHLRMWRALTYRPPTFNSAPA